MSNLTALFAGGLDSQQYSSIGTSCQRATALHHEEHEVLEGDPNLPPGTMINAYPYLHALHVLHGDSLG